ncbi:hypothetical protein WS58_05635 [Burkholderia pseudomultivorans]|nr:hypothetical protein WS57_05440 [Burkholderia pseudomultivorans]KVC25447.1 hypothetical protein WS55_16840 [Burkholderia pseudomultivorans]KVC27722.1 hypothetical protein WS56_23475 [Burkholderia pseudomultivorans]KVC50796.1 hypothetical protein WS58_05635 [Burkholderia pseudomultivorans]
MVGRDRHRGFLIRVAARNAPSRVDEARPDNLPNEDGETEGRQRSGALPGVRRGDATTGAGGPKPVAG